MSKEINISIRERKAELVSGEYICGNSDIPVIFDFDEEWNEVEVKTARFVYNGKRRDVVFSGNECVMPRIMGAYLIKIGVFAGDLRTTTPAVLMAKKSILCDGGMPEDPAPDVYAQLMDLINKGGASTEAIQKAVQDYFEKNPQQGVTDEHIREIAEALLEAAKESGEFDGPVGDPGASAYQIAVKNGFAGSEEEWLASLKGKDAEDGHTPVKGEDYFTEAEKAEFVSDVIARLPIYNGEVEDL